MQAIIRKVSGIDATGQVGVGYDITDSKGSVLYPSQSYFGDASNVIPTIQAKLQGLTTAQTQANLVVVGQVVTL